MVLLLRVARFFILCLVCLGRVFSALRDSLLRGMCICGAACSQLLPRGEGQKALFPALTPPRRAFLWGTGSPWSAPEGRLLMVITLFFVQDRSIYRDLQLFVLCGLV